MRMLTALIAALFLSGEALAQTLDRQWTSPDGAISFSHPSVWTVRALPSADPTSQVVFVGAADAECQIWLMPNAASAAASLDSLRAFYANPLAVETWRDIMAPHEYFDGHAIAVSERSVDTTRAWPLQHATLSAPNRAVRASLQGRPGLEIISLCLSFDGRDRSALFGELENSLRAGMDQ